ncbi:MAG: hypothetical protein DME26_15670 [Verrucomicrobia bacterium]|nr:MAG: hypothetical protein DME26_15670 [Verrucomicrobiota bacterium]
MTFLPIVERELRVASRKRSTFWVRIAAALVALVIGSGFLVLTMVGSFGFGTPSLGKALFGALTWLSLAAALSAGLFFTSDCLSEEKREGTIGFLFLTDLRGYDVVFGKLLATSLRGFYSLLAVLPILAVTLLMGGVTGAEFWKTALALVNALFLSLAAGLFVSAMSRDSQKALAATLFLLALLVAGGPVSDAIFAAINHHCFYPVLRLTTPGYLFVEAGAWGKTRFWLPLLGNQAVAWLLLSLTCASLPRTWQEKAAKTSTATGSVAYWWKFGGTKRRAALRRKLVGVNPVLWLACRERWQAVSLWVLTLLMLGGFAEIFASRYPNMIWLLWSYFAGAFTLVLYLGIASQAGRFLVEAKRSGLVELLLATPLTVKQIVQAQWHALLRMFALALVLCLAMQLVGSLLAQRTWRSIAVAATTAAKPPPRPATNATVVTTTTVTGTTSVSMGGFAAPNEWVTLAIAVAGIIAVAANLVALTWFGMWMGLNSKTANLATLKTILFVQIIPWFVVSFASAMIVPLLLLPKLMKGMSAAPSQIMVWYPLITSGLATVLYLAKDVAFLLWARRKLYSEFRERAAEAMAPIRLALPPSPLRRDTPPIIPN